MKAHGVHVLVRNQIKQVLAQQGVTEQSAGKVADSKVGDGMIIFNKWVRTHKARGCTTEAAYDHAIDDLRRWAGSGFKDSPRPAVKAKHTKTTKTTKAKGKAESKSKSESKVKEKSTEK